MECYSMSQYFISPSTMAVVSNPVEHYQTLIFEPDRRIFTTQSPHQILQESCIMAGDTLSGRRAASKRILGTDKKLPIAVDPDRGIFMLPTSALKNKGCIWIQYAHILHIHEMQNQTIITFRNGCTLVVETSRKSFKHLFSRTSDIVCEFKHNILFRNHNDQGFSCPLLQKKKNGPDSISC